MAIKWIGSPNFDSNRKPIDRIIIHWFGAGRLTGVDAQFQKLNGTSAHYAIEDTTVHQYVKDEHVAYHAGVYAMNQRSIGIEHSATPDRPASEETYKTSGALVAQIAKQYNIPLDRTHILKHSEIKATQCCGTVDIDKIIRLAKGESSDTNMTDLQAQDYVKAIQKKYSVFYKAEDVLKYIDERANEIRALQEAMGVQKKDISSLKAELIAKDKAITVLEKTVEVTQNKAVADLAKMEIDCQKKIDDLRSAYAIDSENTIDKYKEEIKKLKESGTTVEVPTETALKVRFKDKTPIEKLTAMLEIMGA